MKSFFESINWYKEMTLFRIRGREFRFPVLAFWLYVGVFIAGIILTIVRR